MTADVSVVIPAYNAVETLEETLESVFRQTVQPLEILVVNDCSQDGTAALAERIAATHPTVRLIRNKVNLGLSGTRNVAIEQSKGRWIALLDADDLWTEDKLEEQLRFAEENPGIDCIGCYYRELFGNARGAVRREFFWPSALIFKREAMLDTMYNPGWRTSENPEFFHRFDRKYTKSGVEKPLMLYRVNLGGIAHASFIRERKAWRLMGENARLRDEGKPEIPYEQLYEWFEQKYSRGERFRLMLRWHSDHKLRAALIHAKQRHYLRALGYGLAGTALNPASLLKKAGRLSSLFTSGR